MVWEDDVFSLFDEPGEERFGEQKLSRYEARYTKLLEEGKEENQRTYHKYAKQEERALLNRLEKYWKNHLLFLHDFQVPFDDNMSERDLRKVKNRQKMAGRFRTERGKEMYCRILSVVETLKRRKKNLFENIRIYFMGTSATL